jgi:hypothetical protein
MDISSCPALEIDWGVSAELSDSDYDADDFDEELQSLYFSDRIPKLQFRYAQFFREMIFLVISCLLYSFVERRFDHLHAYAERMSLWHVGMGRRVWQKLLYGREGCGRLLELFEKRSCFVI